MSRNLTAILLAAAMVLCLFAGCGNAKSPAESSAVSAVSSTAEASKAIPHKKAKRSQIMI